jgi:hypothetical protein
LAVQLFRADEISVLELLLFDKKVELKVFTLKFLEVLEKFFFL